MHFKLGISVLFAIIFFSCNQKKYNNCNLVEGKWGFYSHNMYGELYVDSINLVFKLEDGTYGPYHFQLVNDTLKYFTKNYKVSFEGINSIRLENDNELIIMKRITSFSTDHMQIDPFYLRKCNYMVNNNYIDMDSAINYLCSIEILESVSDTIIKINK